MKSLSLFVCIFCISTARAQFEDDKCSSPYFTSDTSFYFFINELKPCGDNTFLEIWNCKSIPWCADTLVVSGTYSGGTEYLLSVIFQPQSYSVLPVPEGLLMQDGIRIRRPWDTVDRYSMSYTITDTSHSIGFCDGWYSELSPTSGFSNGCIATSLQEVESSGQKLVALFDLSGRELPVSKTISGILIAVYEDRAGKRIKKLIHFGD